MAPVIGSAGRTLQAASALTLLWATGFALSQPTAPVNGPRRTDPAWHAFINAVAVPEPGKRIENATLVVRDGRVVSLEPGAAPPNGARVWDCMGLTIYPGLIDAYVPVEARRPEPGAAGAHWNREVIAQRSALDGAGLDADARKKLRSRGFALAAIAPKAGNLRGTGAIVSLSEPGLTSSDPLAAVLASSAFHTVSIDVDRTNDREFPSSKMGAIALVRQVLADVPWRERALSAYQKNPAGQERPPADDALDALAASLPLVFDVENELDALRCAKIASEFNKTGWIVGSGSEFRRLDAVVATGLPIVLPLSFAEKPEVATLGDREATDLRQLMAWEASPTNAARLDRAGAVVALTASKLPKDQDFEANLREAIRAGLAEDRALAMLTTTPAKILGVEGKAGRLAPGMNANFVVVKGSLFDKERQIRDVWIDGVRHEVNPAPRVDLEGSWSATFDAGAGPIAGAIKVTKKKELTFERQTTDADRAREAAKKKSEPAGNEAAEPKPEDQAKDEATKGEAKKDDTRSFKARSVNIDENRLDFILDGEALGVEGPIALSAIVETEITGGGVQSTGAAVTWSASRSNEKPAAEKKDDEESKDRYAGIPESFGLPFGPFAFDQSPEAGVLWITGATIWTSGPDGIIENGVLHVDNGKIVGVYPGDRAPRVQLPSGARTIDARGKHISPGLIDCHSHTGISGGVNEGTQSCTAEVRIFDVIDPDAVGWYRELAGGLTAVNQLHGSANSIGGQNSVAKIRWGARHPDDMRVKGAPGGIKFALGENVKQSNWGERFTTRYPQTRMGVETYIRDRFTAAREYDSQHSRWKTAPESERAAGAPPRRDLELEALAEILRGERLVHCHSYRQDEILMLCRVAKDFGFKIGTFQHVLEGYKVAEAIREQAIGGSAFSDWWAYKFEVVDAIPYAGAIMHDAGVVVSFNSDSDELARRMNTEAAKAVKYGGVDPAEALKFVTLNPAKQLKIDSMTGSLEAGKDADFVIWSGSPLSTISRCEATYVDGKELFSLERDKALRQKDAAERARILKKLLSKPAKKDEKEGKPERDAAPRRRAADVTDEPPPYDEFTSSGRGRWLAPTDGDVDAARRHATMEALERHFNWMITNGLDPRLMHSGDCGCTEACFFSN